MDFQIKKALKVEVEAFDDNEVVEGESNVVCAR
jgi:hypothetical protein